MRICYNNINYFLGCSLFEFNTRQSPFYKRYNSNAFRSKSNQGSFYFYGALIDPFILDGVDDCDSNYDNSYIHYFNISFSTPGASYKTYQKQ